MNPPLLYIRRSAPLLMGFVFLLALEGCRERVEQDPGAIPGVSGRSIQQSDSKGEVGAPSTWAPIELPADPKAALQALLKASEANPVAVFKHSPVCPISAAADERFRTWVADHASEEQLSYVHIDVIAQKPLARGLVAELDVKHESPQILLFKKGELVWHASHAAITGEALSLELAQ